MPFRPLVNLPGGDRIGGDQRFGQVEIVGNLPFVIGEDETVIALRGRPDRQTIQRSQDQVRGLPVLFCPTADGQIVPGPVTIKGVKSCLENVASIGSMVSSRGRWSSQRSLSKKASGGGASITRPVPLSALQQGSVAAPRCPQVRSPGGYGLRRLRMPDSISGRFRPNPTFPRQSAGRARSSGASAMHICPRVPVA